MHGDLHVHVFASCARVCAQIFTQNFLVVHYSVTNLSLNFIKIWSSVAEIFGKNLAVRFFASTVNKLSDHIKKFPLTNTITKLLNMIFSSHKDMPAYKRSALFGLIMLCFAWLDPVWPRLALLDLGWLCLTLLGLAWPCLALLDIAWPCLTPLGPAWPILNVKVI